MWRKPTKNAYLDICGSNHLGLVSHKFLISAGTVSVHNYILYSKHVQAYLHTPLHMTEQLSWLFIYSFKLCFSQRATLWLSYLSVFMMISAITPFTCAHRRTIALFTLGPF